MKNIFSGKPPQDESGTKKTFDGVEIKTRDELTVADAIRMKADGYEFEEVKKERKGYKKYIFKKK